MATRKQVKAARTNVKQAQSAARAKKTMISKWELIEAIRAAR